MKVCRNIHLFAALLLPLSLHAGGTGETEPSVVPYRPDREVLHTRYEYICKDNPAMLSWWNDRTFAEIGISGDYAEGKLHHPLTCDRLLKGTVYTRSIVRLKENRWVFSGSFIYENGQADTVRSNLSYRLGGNGSPSLFFCRYPGNRWNIQKYGLTASASRKFGSHWSAGISAIYTGDMAFRKNDVRNSQTTLDIDIRLAASCRIGRYNTVSAGAAYLHSKEKPNFSIMYSSGADYTIYLINGLGTYLSELQSNMVRLENAPGAFVQWMQKSPKNEFSALYSFRYGNDGWNNMSMQAASRQQVWTAYRYLKHEVKFSETFFAGGSSLALRGGAVLTAGSGDTWNKTSSVFIQNYNYSGMDADVLLEWRPGMKILESVTAGAGYTSERKQDKSYDYRFGCSLLDLSLTVRTGFKIRKLYAGIYAGGTWRHSLSVSHSPGAAGNTGNLYTENIGIPLSEWYAADIAGISAGLSIDIPAGQNIIALNARYGLDMSPGTNRNFNTAQLSISFFF